MLSYSARSFVPRSSLALQLSAITLVLGRLFICSFECDTAVLRLIELLIKTAGFKIQKSSLSHAKNV
jgi:hypothetical protein